MVRLVAGMGVLVAVAVLCPARADACSVTQTYMAPTNYELVADTPLIVVALAKSSTDRTIEMDVETVIRGTGAKVGDALSISGDTTGYQGASPKNDFSQARPGAYSGGCTAWDYALGKRYVLFLTQTSSGWTTAGYPFARVNEEVDAKADAWTAAVTEYARIAALATPQARGKAFAALVAKAKNKQATAADKAIAADVTVHLATPSPFKAFADNKALYDAATGDARLVALMAIATSADPAAKDFMLGVTNDLVADTKPVDRSTELTAIAAYYEKVADRDALASLAAYYVKLGSAYKDERWSLMWLLIHHADDTHLAIMERALDGADEEEAGRLVEWFVAHPSKYATKEIKRRCDGKYAERDELARALAGLGDADVIVWAKRKLAAKPDDSRWVALYAIAASPTAAADKLAGQVIAKGGNDLTSLLEGYAYARHANAETRLAEIEGKQNLSRDQRDRLSQTREDRRESGVTSAK